MWQCRTSCDRFWISLTSLRVRNTHPREPDNTTHTVVMIIAVSYGRQQIPSVRRQKPLNRSIQSFASLITSAKSPTMPNLITIGYTGGGGGPACACLFSFFLFFFSVYFGVLRLAHSPNWNRRKFSDGSKGFFPVHEVHFRNHIGDPTGMGQTIPNTAKM